MHARDIENRDLKPSNVLLRQDAAQGIDVALAGRPVQRRRGVDGAGGIVRRERVRRARRGGQRVGMGGRLLAPELGGCAGGRLGVGARR